MTFKVVHIGDAHLRQDARQPDRLAALDQIIAECLPIPNVGLWAIPGDLHDAGSDVDTRNAWAERLLRMADRAVVLICYGNHDRPRDLEIYGKLKGRFPIHVIDRPQILDIAVYPHGAERGPVWLAVFVLPYPHPAGLVSGGVAPDQVVATARGLLDTIFLDAGAKLEAARHAGRPTLFLGHVNVSGSRTSTGQPLVGAEIEADEALLWRLGDCYKGLNHIHMPQEIGGAVHVGSICRLSFGETEEKRYVVVEYESLIVGEPSGPWTWQVTSHPIAVAPMVLVKARYVHEVDADAVTYDVVPEDVPAGADVRVRVEYRETEHQFFERGKAEIERRFAHVSRLQIEPVCLADRGLRSPEVAAAQTTPEKLRAWCHANDEPVPPGLDEAVGVLETQDSDQVIATCRTEMEALLQDPVDESVQVEPVNA